MKKKCRLFAFLPIFEKSLHGVLGYGVHLLVKCIRVWKTKGKNQCM